MDEILIENASKKYQGQNSTLFHALSDINLTIYSGEFLSIIGQSGSGKSTLAKIILGFEKPDTGRVILDGTNIEELKKTKQIYKKIQAVFQDTNGTLNPKLSVYHNVEESLVNLTKLNLSQRKSRILELMSLVGMDKELLKTDIRKLSGGEQRRLSLLRALAVHPKYLVLDEVTSGLDSISQNLVENLLKRYHKKYQCGYLLITHDKSSAYRLSDRIIRMENGRITQQGVANKYNVRRIQNEKESIN